MNTNNQLFKKPIKNDSVYDLLEKICSKTNSYYIIDQNAYKKLIYHGFQTDFCKSLLDCYHVSKQFYVTRKLTYNSFTNIIRQICKTNNIMFTSNIKYNESKYVIEYYIYFPKSAESVGTLPPVIVVPVVPVA